MKHRVAGADITVSKLPARADVSQELLGNLLEKYADLKHQGKTDEEAYQAAVASFGDLSEIMEHVPHTKVGNQTTATARKPSARSSMLNNADLADTDLSGVDFTGSAVAETNFGRSNLTGAKFKSSALKGSSFDAANPDRRGVADDRSA